jgi:hypothetical protein
MEHILSINSKKTSPPIGTLAARTLQDPHASEVARSLAASVLAQRQSGLQTGAAMEDKAARVLASEKYADDTRRLAASLVSQSNVER